MADFGRYLGHDDAEPDADGVVYRQAAVWLADEEFSSMVSEIEHAVVSRMVTPGMGADLSRR
jgi:hypothetical protein